MYTLGFIKCNDTVLLLNRQKAPHMGKWNGVGGKLDPEETPLECIVRETIEETGLTINNYACKGRLRWFRDGTDLGFVWLFTGSMNPEEVVETYPQGTREGILDWKKLDWITHKENVGIVDNIKLLWEQMWNGKDDDEYVAEYSGNQLVKVYKDENRGDK